MIVHVQVSDWLWEGGGDCLWWWTKSQSPRPPEAWRSSQSVAPPQWGTQLLVWVPCGSGGSRRTSQTPVSPDGRQHLGLWCVCVYMCVCVCVCVCVFVLCVWIWLFILHSIDVPWVIHMFVCKHHPWKDSAGINLSSTCLSCCQAAAVSPTHQSAA